MGVSIVSRDGGRGKKIGVQVLFGFADPEASRTIGAVALRGRSLYEIAKSFFWAHLKDIFADG